MSAQEQKLAEFFHSGAADEVPIDTLEFRHPAFVGPDGVTAAAARFVNDPNDPDGFAGTLEDDAPMDAGQEVVFACGAFDAQLPEQTTTGLPSANISVDNVTRQIVPLLKLAVANPAPIAVTYRAFVATDPSAPAQIVDGLSAKSATVSGQRVTASLSFEDFLSKPLLTTSYNRTEYPGLDR